MKFQMMIPRGLEWAGGRGGGGLRSALVRGMFFVDAHRLLWAGLDG